MTNERIRETALKQSAIDSGCKASDFLKDGNTVVASRKDERARKYLTLPFDCDLVCYGRGIVASVREDLREPVSAYIEKFSAYHCFETPNLLVLEESLAPFGLKVCFMAEYFLPDLSLLREEDCGLETRLLSREDFRELYTPEWSHALCADRKELDVLGVGAYDREKLVGLAACSADCEEMYQIGIDVLPEYRNRGLASCLTGKLTREILALDKVPFYCAAWSNIPSVRNAIRCGFRPAWAELTAKPAEFVNSMNLGTGG